MEQSSAVSPNIPQTPPGQAPLPQREKSSIGPLIGTLIIVLIIAAGGLYFWGAKLNSMNSNNLPPLILGDDSAGLPPTSSSDSVAAIEMDVSATDMDTLEREVGADMQAIDSSM
ncbi:MAG: hypothetical protein G01um10148_55 [Parcubacteria group bacterium Gr01-1014_8]|nr:MAG: hypothetical protein G01um10148_55 [Parcubacteria group bacterium Gr01-1014_8]